VLPDPETVLTPVLPDPETGPDALEEPSEALLLPTTGDSPLVGDAPAGVVVGAVGLLETEVTGVTFGLAVVLAVAVGLPQLVAALCLARFFLVPLALALALAVAFA
jgi:hypothetical protein